MKSLVLFFFLSVASISNAQWFNGIGKIDMWTGEYEVTSCKNCPDHVLDHGVNMKNVKRFFFDYTEHEKGATPACGQLFASIGYSISIGSDDGVERYGRTTFWPQCYWGKEKFLDITDTYFIYSNTIKPEKTSVVEIKRLSQNKFKIMIKEAKENPSFGYPTFFEYDLEAIKITE
jgi:hypothetical protein